MILARPSRGMVDPGVALVASVLGVLGLHGALAF